LVRWCTVCTKKSCVRLSFSKMIHDHKKLLKNYGPVNRTGRPNKRRKRNPTLTHRQRATILAMRNQEPPPTFAVIAEQLNLSRTTISSWHSRYKHSGIFSSQYVENGGRKRKLDARTDRFIKFSALKQRKVSATSLANEVHELGVGIGEKPDPKSSNPKISANTISRRLRESGVCSNIACRKPFISPKNQKWRLAWAKAHLKWTAEQWAQVMWTDESPFVLRWVGRQRVWRRPGERYLDACMCGTVKHDKKIMVWGCFAKRGVGTLHRIRGIMFAGPGKHADDSPKANYWSILKNHAMPSGFDLFGREGFMFQQDSDPKHTAKINKAYLANKVKSWPLHKNPRKRCCLSVMNDWPSQSPDLNPIENLWQQLNFATKNRKPQNEDELFEVLKAAWEKLDPKRLEKLVESMHDRCQAVINSRGMPTKY